MRFGSRCLSGKLIERERERERDGVLIIFQRTEIVIMTNVRKVTFVMKNIIKNRRGNNLQIE